MNSCEQLCIQLRGYNNKLISEHNTGERNALFQLIYDLQWQHAIIWHATKYTAPFLSLSSASCPPSFHTQAVSKILVCTCNHSFTSHNLDTSFTRIYIVIVNINLHNNQTSVAVCGYVYFMWDRLRSTFYTSRYQDLLQWTSIILEILLYSIFYTYWVMYDLPDDDLWKIETCGRCHVLIIKLHIDTVLFF
jgi:hypothetical protein